MRFLLLLAVPVLAAAAEETAAARPFMDWGSMEDWSYLVTVVGLPFAILIYVFDKRRERENDEEEIYQELSQAYAEFLKLVLRNADLGLRSNAGPAVLTPEQEERRLLLYDILIALFERAYILCYEEGMDRAHQRRWASWEDYMREWCRRPEFRSRLPQLLEGEDADFAAHIRAIADQEAA